MSTIQSRKISRYEIILGLAVIAVAALAIPELKNAGETSRAADTQGGAARIAQAVLDYHTQHGRWPARQGETIELSTLARPTTATVGTMAGIDASAPLADIPVDSWGRPYRAVVFDERRANVTIEDGIATDRSAPKPAPYPHTPPRGVTIVVLSAGADGRFETEPGEVVHAPIARFRGDDLGFVLRGTAIID